MEMRHAGELAVTKYQVPKTIFCERLHEWELGCRRFYIVHLVDFYKKIRLESSPSTRRCPGRDSDCSVGGASATASPVGRAVALVRNV